MSFVLGNYKNISPDLCVAVIKVSSTGETKCLQLCGRDNTVLRTFSLVQNTLEHSVSYTKLKE